MLLYGFIENNIHLGSRIYGYLETEYNELINGELMKLYGVGNSRSFRTIWAAEEAVITYEYVGVEFGGTGESGSSGSTYRQLNYQGKVPTMIDGELVLTESAAIVNYIATKNIALNLIPKADSAERALYDQLVFFVLTDLEQPLWTNGKHRFAIPEKWRVPKILETTKWEFEKSQKALKNMIGAEPEFALDDHFTMADILVAHTLNWADSFKFELHDGFRAYKNRMIERVAYQAALTKLKAE
ncbi:MAG: glutathione S-transferase [Oleiphilaceae bacterium]|jgi:glutathione S-transferase